MSDVAVVVIGLDEAATLSACIRSVLSSPAPPARVVYVDSGSRDDSVRIARELGCEIVEIGRATANPARARNAGLARCEESVVQFVDGDMTLDGDWLATGRAFLHANPDVVCTFGHTCEDRRERASWMDDVVSIDWEGRVAGDTSAPGGGGMFLTEALQRVGGYDASLVAAEETELGARLRRAGGRIVLLDAPMAAHRSDLRTIGALARRFVRSGRARAQLVRLDPRSWFSWDVLRPEVYAAVGVLAILAAGIMRSLLPLTVAAMLVALLAARQAWRLYARTRDARRALLGAAVTYAALPAQVYGFARGMLESAKRGEAA